jgi:hypothetical protein
MDCEEEMFVVQRCWFSGPQQYQPLDYLRLFTSQRDAEEAAYHSAHAWSRYHNPNSDASIRTLLLPRYPAHNSKGTSYGFIAYGSLFWVRSLSASVSKEYHEGYVVLTEGVIGGTGNKNSRRGTEIHTGRVFVGSNSRMVALRACHQIMDSLPQGCNTYMATMPIGKPSYVDAGFLQDWPPQVLQPKLVMNQGLNEQKRESHWLGAEEGRKVQCPFEQQPNAKRRRFYDVPSTDAFFSEENMLMG